MTSQLSLLRSRLTSLRQARAVTRAASAWMALGSGILMALFGCLALDYLFRLAIAERIVVIVMAIVAMGWAFWRFTWPLLGHRESEEQLAIVVERQNEIDSDLVAALQFESAQAATWGSPQLS